MKVYVKMNKKNPYIVILFNFPNSLQKSSVRLRIQPTFLYKFLFAFQDLKNVKKYYLLS